MTAHWDQDSREKLRASLMGLGAALVWLLIVGGISFAWAGGFSGPSHEGAAETAGAPAAQH